MHLGVCLYYHYTWKQGKTSKKMKKRVGNISIMLGLQVIDPQSWDMIFDRMYALPPSTRHLVMVTTVPVVYPQVSMHEADHQQVL